MAYCTYKIQVVVFDCKKRNKYEPEDTIREKDSAGIHLLTRKHVAIKLIKQES